MTKPLNFDHAAATTVRPEVWAVIENLKSSAICANPSSVHTLGRKAKGHVDEARINLAELMLVKPEEVIFTSGATEALVTAIVGGYLALPHKRGVVYTSPLVHSCVWAGLNYLAHHHAVQVKTLPLLKTGHLDLEKINDELIGESDMIITEHINSEFGVLQPAAKLGKKLIRYAEENQLQKPVFVVDAAASAVSELVGLEFQKCDFLALSAEKIGGLSGTGLLLKKDTVALSPLIGGSQEWGWRGGTENIIGIVALAAAYTAHHKNLETQIKNNIEIKKGLLELLKTEYPDYKILTPAEGSGSHILSVFSTNTPAHLLVAQADLAGVALSAGSACSSGSAEGSKGLVALGYSEADSHKGLRFSWGWDTTLKDLETLKTKLAQFF